MPLLLMLASNKHAGNADELQIASWYNLQCVTTMSRITLQMIWKAAL